jgi:4-carboxymuconolactone decarboxylase
MARKKLKPYDLGLKQFIKIRGKASSKNFLKETKSLSPDYAKYAMEFVWGEIWSRHILDYKTKELITIATLATMGGKENRVKEHVIIALRNGIKLDEILEVMIHLAAYAGFPTASNGLDAIKDALNEVKKH